VEGYDAALLAFVTVERTGVVDAVFAVGLVATSPDEAVGIVCGSA
jgi:hypothetical protein